ncbi:unnamed protein product, partial [Polarella glacialis]
MQGVSAPVGQAVLAQRDVRVLAQAQTSCAAYVSFAAARLQSLFFALKQAPCMVACPWHFTMFQASANAFHLVVDVAVVVLLITIAVVAAVVAVVAVVVVVVVDVVVV